MSESQPYEWSKIGGHLSLDLGNTVSWRLDPARTIERLPDAARLADWFCTLTKADVRPSLEADLAAHPQRAGQALQSAKDLRGAMLRLIDAQLDSTPGSARDSAHVGEAWRQALDVAELPASLPLTPTIVPSTLPLLTSYLALSVADLLHRSDLSTLGRCGGPGCGWLFLDTTRNHSRRWCDPTDCGNRARVRRYVDRRRAG